MTGIWAVIPVKELDGAKQRLAGFLTPAERLALAITMMEEVLATLAASTRLAGVAVVTLEPRAQAIARRHGWRLIEDGARTGHTGSVDAGRRALADKPGVLTLPIDIPAATPAEIDATLAAHTPGRAFTIVPAYDEKGSNTVIVSPPLAVALRFGDNSYFPHLDAARAVGIEPTIVPQPGIGMDIDRPEDLAVFLKILRPTRTRALLNEMQIEERLRKQGVLF